uniref:ATP synthase complex subunit 8 n=1 Tax=Eospalax fontanierii baileyi TaxID=146132 RepID=I6N3E8_EOSFB|nr:ATP synthase F0 subunit 8 [Eospalax fontanierii baileyi]AEO27443.1 ATP synthase F0 subunit 8 [Eospalax fontanierii baileyi]
MPQLDTSTWFNMILFSLITLFIIFQLKFSKFNFYTTPLPKTTNMTKNPNPWESKWTKIYSPLSLPLH